MKPVRNRSALIWLAAAVMVVATVARADAGAAGSAAYTHSVIEFLSGHQNSGALAAHGVLKNWSHQPRTSQPSGSDFWQTMLPVSFIGLTAPLSLVAFRTNLFTGHVPASPTLSPAFQRPPPAPLA